MKMIVQCGLSCMDLTTTPGLWLQHSFQMPILANHSRWMGAEGREELRAPIIMEYSFPVEEKTMSPTSTSHRMASSCAFLNSPRRLFEKVTCLAAVFSIFLIFIFSRAI
ncbi:unnamed protein product [Spirodela intermedia]|uniref:Uncharacterized protein n=1 Tax=Spirodela intermedia TaxID=51605 RepID=A0A7I8KDI7_SPIIN|nr:unnamed protein product [Spirodela intermedia]